MKGLVLLVFIFSVCSGGQFSPSYGYGRTSHKHERIERPCGLHDVDCIRRVFAHNSDCKLVKGRVPDPFILDWLPIHLAHANVTFILKNAQVRGLNDWKIKEFYINRATDKLVLEVVFDAVTVYSPTSTARYHRKGREPIELSDYSVVIYRGTSLTLTVPNVKNLQLTDAHVFAYIFDSNPAYSVGSSIVDYKDTAIAAVFSEMTGNIANGLREVFVQKGPAFMSAFLKSVICDFGDKQSLL